jgi:hypothetical protein
MGEAAAKAAGAPFRNGDSACGNFPHLVLLPLVDHANAISSATVIVLLWQSRLDPLQEHGPDRLLPCRARAHDH